MSADRDQTMIRYVSASTVNAWPFRVSAWIWQAIVVVISGYADHARATATSRS